ncbi:response regulator [Rheinheimera riviphila]|uniref:Response regulator n=1 Tax=Rheinheimera riviphila TaxID=1834037 RepID=A0A437QFI8_9GAMM|nr:response regulator [Rheinheimera riviphila]RVU33193.1 response regulator [Rheinheimera riviphila]
MKQLFSRTFWPLQLLIAALAAAILGSGWLLQQWQHQQTTLQIQLLNNSASLLSIQPLQHKQAAALEVTLHALQQHSALPIRAMAVFDQSQRMFASTSKADRWLEQAAQSLDSEQAAFNDAGVQLISTPIWADRALTTQSAVHPAPAEHNEPDSLLPERNLVPAPAVSSRQLGYLLVLLDDAPTPLLTVLSPLYLLLGLAVWLVWLSIRQLTARQLVQHEQFARQLNTDQALSAESSDTDPVFKPLQAAWQEKMQQFRQQTEVLSLQFQTKLNQLESQLLLSQQTTSQLAAKQQQALSQLQSSSQQLDYWQQLAANAERLTPGLLLRQLQLLALYTRLHEPDFMLQPDALLLPDWMLLCYTDYLQDCDSGHQFLFEEDSQAYAFKVNFDPVLLAHLLELLATMCRKLATEPEIIFSYRLVELPQKLLKINIKFIGRSFPARWRQVLASGVDTMQPDDLDAEVCRSILQQLQGQLQIASIDDVGTQLEILLPVSWQKTNTTKRFQSILLVDEKECRLPLAKQSLAALGEQVHCCFAYAQLKETLPRRLVDLLVLVLPDQPAQLAIPVAELNALQQRFQVQTFANPAAVARWQALLSCPVSAMPLLIGQLSAPQPQALALQQLLVVDDNLTNLSYVRAVLALEGLRIDIAMTGDEAIKMASNNRYQLILMDIQLPDLPGTEVTKQIRQLRHHQQTVILAFTAHALPDEIASFRLAGMDDVLIKPLDTQKIAHILGRIKALDQS